MRCLIITQYYPPETGAAPNRLSDWAQRLAAWGHQVTVITAVPNYPKGEIFPNYQDCLLYEEKDKEVRVLRARIYVTPGSGFVRRLITYFSFVLASLIVGIARVGKQDVILVESPPLFLGLTGLWLKLWLRARMVFNVSDLWPESAVSMGVLHNRLLIWLSRKFEELLYRSSDLVLGQTAHIVADIEKRVRVPAALITNGVDLTIFSDSAIRAREVPRHAFGFSDKFVVGYAGLFGMAQGLDVVLDAAELLLHVPDILFVLFGDGPEKERLMQHSQRRGLFNVRFYPPESKRTMPALMASFDATLVPLKHLDLFKGALPCKLFESMAAGTAVIVGIEGEAQSLVEDAEGGICIPPEDASAIAAAVRRLRADPELRNRLGRNARSYVIANYDRRDIASKLACLLSQIVETKYQASYGSPRENRLGARRPTAVR